MNIRYMVYLDLRSVQSNEFDHTSEFYGTVWYRVDGQGDWLCFANTSNNNPWVVGDEDKSAPPDESTGFLKALTEVSAGGKSSGGSIKSGALSQQVRVGTQELILPESAKTIQFETILHEYDPGILDPDEDLGFIQFEVAFPKELKEIFIFGSPTGGFIYPDTEGRFYQGSASTGVAEWTARIWRGRD